MKEITDVLSTSVAVGGPVEAGGLPLKFSSCNPWREGVPVPWGSQDVNV
jgi:hypothetical protein